jgi:recombination protein RecA
MAKKTEKTDKEIIKDDIAHSLADVLNKQFKKDGQVAYFIDGNTPTDVNDWVSTGSSMLDLAISNRPHGGLPIGRIVEFNGLEASGKSLLAAHSIASAQEKGGLGVYIDTENALSKDFLEAIGVDVEKMLYVQLDTVEQIFQTIEQIITTIRESDKNKLVVIVVDSLAAASTSLEMENDYEKQGWNTGKAIVVSAAFRKITRLIGKERVVLIFTNQLRQKMGVMFGDPWTTSGGKGLPFHASIRVRLKAMGQIKQKIGTQEQVIGVKARGQVIKNRIGPSYRIADFDIYFNRGVYDYENWLEILKDNELVTRSNPGFKIVDQKGEERKFETKNWGELLESDPEFKEFLYQKICDYQIMKYKSKSDIGLDSDDIIVTDEVIGDD